MRLSNKLIKQLLTLISLSYGEDVDVYLFGSRTDDLKKGGDIDLAIDSQLSNSDFKQASITFRTQLLKQGLNDLSIDLTQLSAAENLFLDEINHTKIKLNA